MATMADFQSGLVVHELRRTGTEVRIMAAMAVPRDTKVAGNEGIAATEGLMQAVTCIIRTAGCGAGVCELSTIEGPPELLSS